MALLISGAALTWYRLTPQRGSLTAALSAALACGLASCGGNSTSNTVTFRGADQQQIAALVKAYGANPKLLCTRFASPRYIRSAFGSVAHCLSAAGSPGAADPAVKVDSVTVRGRTATAVRTSETNPGKGTKAIISLTKASGQWKVLAVAPTR